MSLTAARLRELLSYDPETGIFTWRVALSRRVKVGQVAGCLYKGYRQIAVEGRIYRAHRLAFLYVTGAWPIDEVDHINGVPRDNRWSNLRSVSRIINLQNRRGAQANNVTGYLGVSQHGKKFAAQIDRRHLGVFDTPEEAHAAYLFEKRKVHKGCTI